MKPQPSDFFLRVGWEMLRLVRMKLLFTWVKLGCENIISIAVTDNNFGVIKMFNETPSYTPESAQHVMPGKVIRS